MSGSNKLTIDIHFDLICPWCFIGKRQLALARARFAQKYPAVAVESVWHPVQLLPDVPEQGLPFAEFYERRLGSPEAVRQRQQQVALAARSVGLDLDLAAIQRMPNTARAHRSAASGRGAGRAGVVRGAARTPVRRVLPARRGHRRCRDAAAVGGGGRRALGSIADAAPDDARSSGRRLPSRACRISCSTGVCRCPARTMPPSCSMAMSQGRADARHGRGGA